MIPALIEAEASDSVDELRARLAGVIGWPDPVPVPAFFRAVVEPTYALALITSRNEPGFLEPLLHDPRNERFVPESMRAAAAVAPDPTPRAISDARLLANAARAMVRWGKAGFTVADEATIALREQACLGCEHLIEPNKLLQKLLPVGEVKDEVGRRTGHKVCALCGCQAARKIRLPTESCPAKPDRWSERQGV
jgi:hypothetical protein